MNSRKKKSSFRPSVYMGIWDWGTIIGISIFVTVLMGMAYFKGYSYAKREPIVGGTQYSEPFAFGKQSAYHKIEADSNPYLNEPDRIEFLKGYVYELQMERLIPNDK